MRKIFLFSLLLIMTITTLFVTGCAIPERNRTGAAANQTQQGEISLPPGASLPAGAGLSSSEGQKRFDVICEMGETKNLGGYTVLRDRQTGKEYLVITGLNGAPAVININ